MLVLQMPMYILLHFT